MIIALDPGHGGENVGCHDGLENVLNLELALLTEELLHFIGFDTIITRREETTVHFGERKSICDEADLVLSIHHNSWTNPLSMPPTL